MSTAIDVADYFLSKIDREAGDLITQLKLYKLVYYAQAWSLVFLKRPLFQSEIQAWVHGPVPVELRPIYSGYAHGPIPEPSNEIDLSLFEYQELKVLDLVWDIYGGLSARQLEDLSHSESPWIKARGEVDKSERSTNPISNSDIREYYADYGSITKEDKVFLIDPIVASNRKDSPPSFSFLLDDGEQVDAPINELESKLQEFKGRLLACGE
jgi:uncharacterized phage-associated protein